MLNYFERSDNEVRDYIKDRIPEHLNGYDNGWLLVNHIYTLGNKFSHVYSWQDGEWVLIGTQVGFVAKEEV